MEITQYSICKDGEVLREALSDRISERLCLRKYESKSQLNSHAGTLNRNGKHIFETLQFFWILENAVTSRHPFEENANSFYVNSCISISDR